MKNLFVVLSCLVAFTWATGYGPHYPINIPVIGHTGVPLESHEIVHARRAHLEHVHAVQARQGHGFGGYGGGYGGGFAYGAGAPIDTPEVQAARAAHFAAYHKAAARNGVHLRKRRSPQYGGEVILHKGGVPVDTPEVQAARAAHFAAKAHAGSGGGGSGDYDRGYEGGYGGFGGGFRGDYSQGGYHIPVIGPKGVPIDTPEVQAARARHLAALAEAHSRGNFGEGRDEGYGGGYGGGFGNDFY